MSLVKIVCLGANNPEIIRFFNTLNSTSLVGFIDNDQEKWGKEFYGYKIFGGVEQVSALVERGYKFCNLITRDCVTRHLTTQDILLHKGVLCNLIHPSVSTDMVQIGIGEYIQESVIIQAGTVLGSNVSIHMGSLIGHESRIADSVFIAHGCNISGIVKIEEGVFIGTGASVLPRLTIGKWSIVGAGAVVTKNVPPYSVVFGNPAKIIKQINPDKTLNCHRLVL